MKPLSINFYLKNKQSKTQTLIFVYVTKDGVRIKISTGLKILPALWDADKQRPTQKTKLLLVHSKSDRNIFEDIEEIDTKIDQISLHIKSLIKQAVFSGKEIKRDQLVKNIKEMINPPTIQVGRGDSIIEYLEHFIEDAVNKKRRQINGSNYRPGTIKNYKNLLFALKKFKKETKSSCNWSDVDKNWYTKFLNWHEDSCGVGKGYTGKHIKDLKAIMRMAFDDGYHANDAFRSTWFYVFTERAEVYPLTKEEVEAIENLELEEETTLCIARDIFLMGYYSGQRVSDIKQFSPQTISMSPEGKLRIQLTQKKTLKKVVLPVHWKLQKILEKYGGRCPKFTEQTVNKKLKKIAKMAGIPNEKAQKLSMHNSRHTFCTHLYKSGVEKADIMQMSGHQTESSFFKYINVKPDESATRIENFDF